MMFLCSFLLLYVWFAFWSAEAGASWPWSAKWQNGWKKAIPESVIALTFAVFGSLIAARLGVPDWSLYILFPVFAIISYAGKQSATWAYLNWEGYNKNDGGRNSTLRKWNDWLGDKLGYKLGDEGYSWVWAFTKGLITTLPVGGLGCIFQPIGREIFSQARGRLPGHYNTWLEAGGDGFGYAMAVTLALLLF